MPLTNTILIIVGFIPIIIGILGFVNPTFASLMNAPDGPRVKGIIAILSGIIILIIGFMIELPG